MTEDQLSVVEALDVRVFKNIEDHQERLEEALKAIKERIPKGEDCRPKQVGLYLSLKQLRHRPSSIFSCRK